MHIRGQEAWAGGNDPYPVQLFGFVRAYDCYVSWKKNLDSPLSGLSGKPGVLGGLVPTGG